MPDVRLAIIGAGFMAQTAHIRCFQLAQGARVVGLASDRPQLRAAVAARFGIPRQYESWRDVCADPEVDAAVVLLPPECNPDITVALLQAGKHVFCEKPMALSLAQAERMAAAAEGRGRASAGPTRLMLGFMKRYDTGIERAKALWDEWGASGELGKLVTARAWCLLGGNWTANIDRLIPILRTDEPHGCKPIADHGPEWLPECLAEKMPTFGSPYYFFNHVHSHNVNLLRHFLGDDYEVTYADFRHRTKVAHLAYGDALVTIETGPGISAYAFEEGLRLYCEQGWMEIIPPPPLQMQGCASVKVYRGGEMMSFQQPMGEYDWSFRRQAQHFVDCVRDEVEPRSGGRDSVGDLAMVEAIFRQATELGTV
jgi:predicted dehydrogenase